MKIRGILFLLVGFAWSALSQEEPWTSVDSWYNRAEAADREWPRDESLLVPQTMLLPVSEAQMERAISMLQSNSAVALDLKTAGDLVSGKRLNPEEMIQAAVKDIEAQAGQREQEAEDPSFQKIAAKLKERATAKRRQATELRNLSGRLKPYLVRALMLNPKGGAFMASFKDGELWIAHGSVGHQAVPMKRHPLVIFLPAAPAKVFLNVSMAR